MIAVLPIGRRGIGLGPPGGRGIGRTWRGRALQALELMVQLVETFMHREELIAVVFVVIAAVRQPHAFFVGRIENDGVEPFADRHAGTARSFARRLPRIAPDALHSPRNAKFHAYVAQGGPDGPAEPALWRRNG